MASKRNYKKTVLQTSSQKLAELKNSGLEFVWKQTGSMDLFSDWTRKLMKTQFIKKLNPGFTFIWVQSHWELFWLAEQPLHLHLAFCEVFCQKILALTIGSLQMESQSFCKTQDVKDLTVAYKVHAGMCLEFKIGLSSLSCRQAKVL